MIKTFTLRQAALWLCGFFFSPSPPPIFFFLWEEMRNFVLVNVFVFVFKTMKKKMLQLAQSKLSHKTLFGHGLSTTHIVPRGVLWLPLVSPAKKKKEHRIKIKLERKPHFCLGWASTLTKLSLQGFGFVKKKSNNNLPSFSLYFQKRH